MSRRTIAKGVAWGVPAITMAAAAPAMATSGPEPTFRFISACKSPGNSCRVFPKGYDLRFEVCNTSTLPIYLYSVSYTVVGTNLTLIHSLPALPAMLAPATVDPVTGLVTPTCVTMVFRADSSTSANQAFTAVMSIPWGHTPTAGTDPQDHLPLQIPFAVTGTPPDCPCTATPQLSRK